MKGLEKFSQVTWYLVSSRVLVWDLHLALCWFICCIAFDGFYFLLPVCKPPVLLLCFFSFILSFSLSFWTLFYCLFINPFLSFSIVLHTNIILCKYSFIFYAVRS